MGRCGWQCDQLYLHTKVLRIPHDKAGTGEQTKEGLLIEVYKQRSAELFMTGLRFEDSRRFGRPSPPTSLAERSRNFYPYPDQERLTNPNTPTDPTN